MSTDLDVSTMTLHTDRGAAFPAFLCMSLPFQRGQRGTQVMANVARSTAVADVDGQAVVTLLSLPDDCLVRCLLPLADDDYHMLTAPLVCGAFARACNGDDLAAARLASRLRQVAAAIVEAAMPLTSEWAVSHAWGALTAAHEFCGRSGTWLPPPLLLIRCCCRHGQLHHCAASVESRHCAQRLAARRACARSRGTAPPHTTSRACLLGWVRAAGQRMSGAVIMTGVRTAEDFFLDAESRRLKTASASSSHMQTLQHRTTSGDRAARQAAAAIGIKFGEARHAMRKEAEAQQRRQLDAAARRRWRQMTPKERREWEHIAHTAEQQEARMKDVLTQLSELATGFPQD